MKGTKIKQAKVTSQIHKTNEIKVSPQIHKTKATATKAVVKKQTTAPVSKKSQAQAPKKLATQTPKKPASQAPKKTVVQAPKKIATSMSGTAQEKPSSAKIVIADSVPVSKKQKMLNEFSKNVSTKIPNGRSFQTRDEFLKGGEPKIGHVNDNKFYRKVFAVDTNSLDEIVVVKSTTSDKGELIKNYNEKSRTRPFLYLEDNEGNRIKPSKKFIENSPSLDISADEAERIKKKSIKYPEDFDKLQKLKRRKKR